MLFELNSTANTWLLWKGKSSATSNNYFSDLEGPGTSLGFSDPNDGLLSHGNLFLERSALFSLSK